jgi:predicted hydrocarbon binding protein
MSKNDALSILNNAVIETQVNADDILYFSGKFAGYEHLKGVKKKYESLEEVKKMLKDNLKKLSIGNIEDVTIKKNKILIKIKNCTFCEKSKASKVKCYFLIGFISGLVSRALNYNFYKFSGKEMKCKNNINENCVFEITSI